jgi:hypothetical protein
MIAEELGARKPERDTYCVLRISVLRAFAALKGKLLFGSRFSHG